MVDSGGASGKAELTTRAVAAGCLLGVVFAIGNVYIGLKTGLTDAAPVTAAILAFAFFRSGGGKSYSSLENNITQNVSSSAAMMPAVMGLISPFPALAMMGNHYPTWLMLTWGLCLGLLGVAFALPLRGRFLSDPSMPFPDAIATAEVIRAMHKAGARALAKARALVGAGVVSALVTWFRDGVPRVLPATSFVPLGLGGLAAAPLLGVVWSPLLFSVGMLLGPRTGIGLFAGGLLAWGVVAPWLITAHIVAEPTFGALNGWLIWPGAALMIAGALTSLARDWRLLARSAGDVRALGGAYASRAMLVPAALALALVLLGWSSFGVSPLVGLGTLAISCVMAVVVARSAGETSVFPLGPIGQLTQLILGPAAQSPVASIVSATVPSGMGGQIGQTLETLKVGRMLGAAPRNQIKAQLVGALVGAPAAVAAYVMLNRAYVIGSADLPAPTASPWKVLAELVGKGTAGLPPYVVAASLVALALGATLTLLDRTRFARFAPSPLAMGLAFVMGAAPAFTMAAGALAYVILERVRPKWTKEYGSSVAAGGLVGEAVMGVVIASLVVAHVLG